MVPNPTSLIRNVPTKEVNNSGELPPAAINVAPATLGDNFKPSAISCNDGTNSSSAIIAINIKKYKTPIMNNTTEPSGFAGFGQSLPSSRRKPLVS